jgi:hypothetical protein
MAVKPLALSPRILASHLPSRATVCYHPVKQPAAQRQDNRERPHGR